MTSFVRKVALACLVGVVGFAGQAQGAATVSLKAVKKNGGNITPTNSVSVVANDVITADVFISGWNNPPFDGAGGLVGTFNASILGAAGAISNGMDGSDVSRLVLPNGWFAPFVRDICPCDVPAYPDCNVSYGCVDASSCVGGTNAGNACTINANCPGGTCDLTGHNPAAMASLDTIRTDFIFFGFSHFSAADVATLNIRFGGTINGTDGMTASRCVAGGNAGGSCLNDGHCSGSTCNQNYLSYAGTVNLKVGSNPCGTYTFTFANDEASTFIGTPGDFPFYIVPAIEGLTLTTGIACPSASGACCDTTNPAAPTCSITTEAACTGLNKRYGGNNSTCANIEPPCSPPPANQIIAVNPPHCAIDARRPNVPGQLTNRQGFTSMTLTFANPLGTGEDAPNDFAIAQVPVTTPPIPPTITSVTPGPGNTLTLNFSGPIQPNRYTCVRHIASNSRRCIGYLPGDANNNRTTNPSDILSIIDNLNGIVNPPFAIYQCDIDRSGICGPPDIITVIDILNGSGYPPGQNGRTIEVCPSTTP